MIETIRVAFADLRPTSSVGLTILGLTIGVGSVIVLVAVGTGSSAAVQKQIDALGSNVLLVTSTPTLGGLRGGPTVSDSLTLADANALRTVLPRPTSRTSLRSSIRRSDARLRRHDLFAVDVRRHDAEL